MPEHLFEYITALILLSFSQPADDSSLRAKGEMDTIRGVS